MAWSAVSGVEIMSAAASASRRDRESKGLRILNDEVRVLLASRTVVDERSFMVAEKTQCSKVYPEIRRPMTKVMGSFAVVNNASCYSYGGNSCLFENPTP